MAPSYGAGNAIVSQIKIWTPETSLALYNGLSSLKHYLKDYSPSFPGAVTGAAGWPGTGADGGASAAVADECVAHSRV